MLKKFFLNLPVLAVVLAACACTIGQGYYPAEQKAEIKAERGLLKGSQGSILSCNKCKKKHRIEASADRQTTYLASCGEGKCNVEMIESLKKSLEEQRKAKAKETPQGKAHDVDADDADQDNHDAQSNLHLASCANGRCNASAYDDMKNSLEEQKKAKQVNTPDGFIETPYEGADLQPGQHLAIA